MRSLQLIFTAFLTFLFVINAVFWRKAIAVLLCGALSFNSTSCYSFLSQGTIANAATPVNTSTVPSKLPHTAASVSTILVDAQRNLIVAASPSTVSLAGKWQSEWGVVEFNSNLTGSWNQGGGKIGQITSGSYDPKARKLVFQYYQSWNEMNGTATFILSEDGNRLSGTWTQQRGSNRPGSGGSGGWTMTRDLSSKIVKGAVVYVWTFRGSNEAWGHASMRLNDPEGTYISWWPQVKHYDIWSWISKNIYTADPEPNQTFTKDKCLEGIEPGQDSSICLKEKEPDLAISIPCIDENKIKDWWFQFKKTHKWKTLSQNCSTTIKDALYAGGAADILTNWEKYSGIGSSDVWTPNLLARLANTVAAHCSTTTK